MDKRENYGLRSLEQPPDHHLNVNKGVQGGNFVHSHLHKPTFNIQSPRGSLLRDHYQIIGFIGEGTYGKTFKVQPKNVHTSEAFAMKVISCSTKDVDKDKKEIEILKKCQHESIDDNQNHHYTSLFRTRDVVCIEYFGKF